MILISCKPENSDMRIKDIVTKKTDVNIFTVVKEKSDNPLDWKIKTRKDKLIPDTEAHCIVRAKMIDKEKNVSDCFINISLPERIVDYVIYQTDLGLEYKESYELADKDVIPAVASEAFGDYELYYSKNAPDVGIEILRQSLNLTEDPSVIAEDLGYILRDENRHQEAIDAFLISEEHGVSSEYIFKEISDLYAKIGNDEKSKEYDEKSGDNLIYASMFDLAYSKLKKDYPDREAAFPDNLPKPNKSDLEYLIDKYDCKFPQSYIDYQLNYCQTTPIGDFAFEGFGWANRELEPYLNLEEVLKGYKDLDFPDYLTPFKQENGDFWCFDNRVDSETGEYPVVIWDHNSNDIEQDKDFQWNSFIDWLEKTMEDDN